MGTNWHEFPGFWPLFLFVLTRSIRALKNSREADHDSRLMAQLALILRCEWIGGARWPGNPVARAGLPYQSTPAADQSSSAGIAFGRDATPLPSHRAETFVSPLTGAGPTQVSRRIAPDVAER